MKSWKGTVTRQKIRRFTERLVKLSAPQSGKANLQMFSIKNICNVLHVSQEIS